MVRIAFNSHFDPNDPDRSRYGAYIVDLIYHPLTTGGGTFTVAPSMYDVDGNFSPLVLDPGVGTGIAWGCPQFSPDGQWLALPRGDLQPDGNWHCSIWVAKADGLEAPTLLIDGTGLGPNTPAWSPVLLQDGRYQLAFISDSTGTNEVYAASFGVDEETGNPTNLVIRRVNSNSDVYEDNPTWSPDGTQIAYDAPGKLTAGQKLGQIGKVMVNTGQEYNVVAGRFPAWSPPGVPPLP